MMNLEKNSFLSNLALRVFLRFKLPMIGYCSPKILTSNANKVDVLIPIKRKTKNHLKSMYFGALCVGADFSGGLLTLNIINKHKSKARLIFKDFQASFLKRALSDIRFTCSDHKTIEKGVLENLSKGTRVNFKIRVNAIDSSGEKVAVFDLTTSIK